MASVGPVAPRYPRSADDGEQQERRHDGGEARGETAADVFYRITLTVTDSSGLSTTETVEVIRQEVDKLRSAPVTDQEPGEGLQGVQQPLPQHPGKKKGKKRKK